jgi:exodeoxyribonuclease-3
MRIATWNVNSLNARMPRVEEWIGYAHPDVLCMQETKVADATFPAMAFAALGYEAAHHGTGRWNGVAILSRIGMKDISAGLAEEGGSSETKGRFVSALCGDVRVASVYVPNGRSVGSEHYQAKLTWLAELKAHLEEGYDPAAPLAVCGDFNVAPEDRDLYDPAKFVGATHVSEPERKALAAIEEWGLVDAFRQRYDEGELFSWWDYRAGDFHQHRGMRIDLILVTRPLAERVDYALIDRFARKGKLPSDHAPVFVDFDMD